MNWFMASKKKNASSKLKKKLTLNLKDIQAFVPIKFDFAHFSNTSQIPVPKNLIGQVIGQDRSVEIIRKAAAQKRNVLLVGIPGTGKSLLAQAMSEILPVQQLQDVLIYPNPEDANQPRVRVLKAGEGKKLIDGARLEVQKSDDSARLISLLLPIGWIVLSTILWQFKWYPDVVFAALIIVGAFLFIGVTLGSQMRNKEGAGTPKLLVNNLGKKVAPFFEATGSRAGALLGDVRHDPLQCHYGFNNLYILKGTKLISKPFAELWDEMVAKHKSEIIKNEKGYEAIMLPEKEKIFTLGEKEGKVVLSRILSLNRKPFDGELTEIEAKGKKIALTPEHKVITKAGDKQAEKVSNNDSLFQISQSNATA
jgi:Lon-like ATP-dependent protease